MEIKLEVHFSQSRDSSNLKISSLHFAFVWLFTELTEKSSILTKRDSFGEGLMLTYKTTYKTSSLTFNLVESFKICVLYFIIYKVHFFFHLTSLQ